MTKCAVLTYLIGNYDKTHKILKKTPDVDYILVTDDPLYVDNSGWQVVYDPDLNTMSNPFDKVLYIRYSPFKYTDADIVVKIDASVQVCEDITPILRKFEDDGAECAWHIHPTRDNVYDELQAWCMQRSMPVEDANKVLAVMVQLEGYNPKEHKGLYELSWSIQRRCWSQMSFNSLAYAFNKYVGNGKEDFRCDQVVASMVYNKYFNAVPTQFYDIRILQGPYFNWYPHASDTPFAPMDTKNLCKAYALNKRITPIRPQDL